MELFDKHQDYEAMNHVLETIRKGMSSFCRTAAFRCRALFVQSALLFVLIANGQVFASVSDLLNDDRYFQILESSRDKIVFRFQEDASHASPSQVKTLIAAPSTSYRLEVDEFAYYEDPNKRENLIQSGTDFDEEDARKITRQIRITEKTWHDLAILSIHLDTVGRRTTDARNRIAMAQFSLHFNDEGNSDGENYQTGDMDRGFNAMIAHFVQNPTDIPMMKTRPEIPFDDDRYHPQSLGSQSPSGCAFRILIEHEGLYEIPFSNLLERDSRVSQWSSSRVALWTSGERIPLEIEGLGGNATWTAQTRLRFWAKDLKDDSNRYRIYYLSETQQPPNEIVKVERVPQAASNETITSVTQEIVQSPQNNIVDGYDSVRTGMQGRWFWLVLNSDRKEAKADLPLLPVEPSDATVTLTIDLSSTSFSPREITVLDPEGVPLGKTSVPSKKDHQIELDVPASLVTGEQKTLTFRIGETDRMRDYEGVFLREMKWHYRSPLIVDERPMLINGEYLQKTGFLQVNCDRELKVYGRTESGTRVWDFSTALVHSDGVTSSTYLFSQNVLKEKEVHRLAFLDSTQWKSPVAIEKVHRDFLHESTQAAQVLYISHPNLIEPIRPLVEFRREQGWDVRLIDIRAIYDEFSHGYFSREAVRNFLIYTQNHWPSPIPEYVCLVGDSTFDPKNNLEQSERDYIPYATFSSRDIGSDPADEWFVRINGSDEVADMILGRICVGSATDARAVVKKTLRYEQHPLPGPWRSRAILFTDNGFEDRTRRMMNRTVPSAGEKRLLEIRDFPQFSHLSFKLRGSNKKWSLQSNRRFITEMNLGADVFQYLGHGGASVMADEALFRATGRPTSDARKLDNRRRLPFVSVYSCLTGLFSFARGDFRISVAEELVRHPEKGAIAVFCPSGKGGPGQHEKLNEWLQRFHFDYPLGTLGEVYTAAEAGYAFANRSASICEQYNYLGDPLIGVEPPSRKGSLSCEPESIDLLDGGVLRITAEDLPLENGSGLIRIFDKNGKTLLRVEPVTVRKGRSKHTLFWPPGTRVEGLQIQGYFWNRKTNKDCLLLETIECRTPRIDFDSNSVSLASDDRGEKRIELQLPASDSLPEIPLRARLVAEGTVVAETRVSFADSAESILSFRFDENSEISEQVLQITVGLDHCLASCFEDTSSTRYFSFIAPDENESPGFSSDSGIMADITALYSPDELGQGIYLNRRGNSSGIASATIAIELQSEGGSLGFRPNDGKSEGSNRFYSLNSIEPRITDATGEEPADTEQPSFRRIAFVIKSASDESNPEVIRSLPRPVFAGGDLALLSLTPLDRKAPQEYSHFIRTRLCNHGNTTVSTPQIRLQTDQSGKLQRLLTAGSNVEQPALPNHVKSGEIVDLLYRIEQFDTPEQMKIESEVSLPKDMVEVSPWDNVLELPMQFEWGVVHQVRPPATDDMNTEEIIETTRRYARERLHAQYRQVAYEEYSEDFANPERYCTMTFFAALADKQQLARDSVEKAAELMPINDVSLYLQALSAFNQGRSSVGSEKLSQAIEHDVFEKDPDNNLLQFFLRLGIPFRDATRRSRTSDWRTAEQELLYALQRIPGNFFAMNDLAEMYFRVCRYRQAADTYTRMALMTGNDYSRFSKDWFRKAGLAFAETGLAREALDIFRSGQQYFPEEDFDLWMALPRIELGEAQSVLASLQQNTAGSPEVEEQYRQYLRARCFEALGQMNEAVDLYREALRDDPLDHRVRKRLLELRTRM